MNNMSRKRINVKQKGANFENEVAKMAMDHLGIKLERNPYRDRKSVV